MSTLHDTDLYSWSEQQARLLHEARLEELDVTNLAEELENMGRSLKSELESRLKVLLMHLLKWQHQPTRAGASWRATITVQRDELASHLQDNPGLKSKVPEALTRAYRRARLEAAGETGLPLAVFAEACPWTFEQILDERFWPEQDA